MPLYEQEKVLYNNFNLIVGGVSMNCLKCGRETEDERIFCEACVEVMKKYPVKPGIAIQLPHRNESPALKKVLPKRRQPPTPEEQIRKLKRRTRSFLLLWLLTLMLLAATIYPAIQYFLQREVPLPGQNYSTFTTIDETNP